MLIEVYRESRLGCILQIMANYHAKWFKNRLLKEKNTHELQFTVHVGL